MGTIGLYLAKNSKKVIGIEINKEAIKNANSNKELNKINNIEFIAGDVLKSLDNISDEKVDILVCDPPRTGLTKDVTDKILNEKLLPKKIIYVSCNHATFAKDLDVLSSKYNIKQIIPFDMFPYVPSIESIATLCLKK